MVMSKPRWTPPPWKAGDRIYNRELKTPAHYKGQWAVGRARITREDYSMEDTGRSGEWVWALTDDDNEVVWYLDDVEWLGSFYASRVVN
jgi:hypothetical protein